MRNEKITTQNFATFSFIDSICGFNSTQVVYIPFRMKPIEAETAQQKFLAQLFVIFWNLILEISVNIRNVK